MNLNDLPFHIGPTEQPSNPGGLPDAYPFKLVFDSKLAILAQSTDTELEQVLRRAYELGQAFGTPLAESKFGKPYAEDFLSFIKAAQPKPGRGLEIGAGVGYLSRRLLDSGWDMTSLEPGRGYEPFWTRYGVPMIREFFPSRRAPGPYHLCVAYGVLEHITNPLSMLRAVKDHLAPEGVAVLSVPDCTEEIAAGDPAILLHEHISYFDAGSLSRMIESVGMSAIVVKSGFGRCLYAIASPHQRSEPWEGARGLEREIIASFDERCSQFISRVRAKMSAMAAKGPVGVYCAARGLALLDRTWPLRFFDDDPAQQGRFLPPFRAAITGRDALFSTPVEHLVIMSRTFGWRIRDSLRKQGYEGCIVTLDEM